MSPVFGEVELHERVDVEGVDDYGKRRVRHAVVPHVEALGGAVLQAADSRQEKYAFRNYPTMKLVLEIQLCSSMGPGAWKGHG